MGKYGHHGHDGSQHPHCFEINTYLYCIHCHALYRCGYKKDQKWVSMVVIIMIIHNIYLVSKRTLIFVAFSVMQCVDVDI